MILEALREQAKTDRVCAVDEEGIKLTFSQLHIRSDALATYFLETLSPKAPVILIGDKENDMLTCLFACMKSGRAYVPLTVSVPERRAEFIARDSDAELIIAFNSDMLSSSPLKRLSEKDIEIITDKRQGKSVHEAHWLGYDDMLALLYTSGSTGTPKGVINCLGDLENLLTAPDFYYIGGPGMKVMNNFSYMFSAHMQHVYRTMIIMGSQMIAVPGAIQKEPKRLVNYYLKVCPDYLGVIATTCAMLLTDSRFAHEHMPQLKGMALAGEVCSRKLVADLFERFPDITVCIQYASTELTTVAVGNCITKEDFDAIKTDVIPVGRAVPSIEAFLWDEDGHEVRDGEKGELVIISHRLCDGYWKQPKETESAFFTLSDGRRGFHTRDLMVRKDGLLYYSGRLDNRIKIGGNRVELEEVETAVSSLEMVHQCVVRPVSADDGRICSLVAYVTMKEETSDHLNAVITIKKALKENLPQYMIPQKIIILKEFKTNTSGKIDRGEIRMFHEEQMKKVYERIRDDSFSDAVK